MLNYQRVVGSIELKVSEFAIWACLERGKWWQTIGFGAHLGPTIFIVLPPVRVRSLIEFKLQRCFPLDSNQFMSLPCLQRKHEITELYNPLTIILNIYLQTNPWWNVLDPFMTCWLSHWERANPASSQTSTLGWKEMLQKTIASSKFPMIQVWDHSNLQIWIENNKSHKNY